MAAKIEVALYTCTLMTIDISHLTVPGNTEMAFDGMSAINLLQHNEFLMNLRKNAFENIVGNRRNAGNNKFVVYSCFQFEEGKNV